MSKYEDDRMELIETVVENSHHNAAKPFIRGAMSNGQLIDAKSAETGMLLERIDKMTEVQNLLLNRLNICNGSEGLTPVSLQEASPCANCSRFEHIEFDCRVMAIQGQGMFRQGPLGGQTQQGRSNCPGTDPNYYNTHVFNNPSQNAGFRRNNDQPYRPPYNGQQQQHQHYANQRQSSFVPPTQPQAYTQAPRQTAPASDPILGAILQLMEQMTRMNSRVDEIQDFLKMNVQPTIDKNNMQVTFTDQLPSQVTERIDAVVNYTPIRVKIKSKLTNLMKISRIEGYSGKYVSNPQEIREISYDLFEIG